MRKILLSIILTAIAFYYALPQDEPGTEYLFSSKKVNFSGFGCPTISFGIADGDFAVYNGGGGAALVNQKFFFGGFGEGISTNHSFPDIAVSATDHTIKYSDLELEVGYGGPWLGYINNSHKLVHWGMSLKFGPGVISLVDRDYPTDKYESVAADFIFVLSPQLELEINMARWFKINFSTGYKYFTGIGNNTYFNAAGQEVRYYKSSMFNTPYVGIGFYFGWFGAEKGNPDNDKE